MSISVIPVVTLSREPEMLGRDKEEQEDQDQDKDGDEDEDEDEDGDEINQAC